MFISIIALMAAFQMWAQTSPFEVSASGFLCSRGDRYYLYVPEQVNSDNLLRTRLIVKDSLKRSIESRALANTFVKVEGILKHYDENVIPVQHVRATSIEPEFLPIRCIGSLNSLEPGLSVRFMATVVKVNEKEITLADFSGSMVAPAPDMAVSPGSRALVKAETVPGGMSVTGYNFFKGRKYSGNVCLERAKGNNMLIYAGDFEPFDGGFILKGVEFPGDNAVFAIRPGDGGRFSVTDAVTPDVPMPLVAGNKKIPAVPAGVYDVTYFPEPEYIVLTPSSGPVQVPYKPASSGDKDIPFQHVEEKPSFNGGDVSEFSKWVNSRLVYPEIAKKNGVQGRVTIQFTVEADGRVTNVKVLRGVDPALDAEAVRVVMESPRWKPGKQDGKPVKVTYTFPVIFGLR